MAYNFIMLAPKTTFPLEYIFYFRMCSKNEKKKTLKHFGTNISFLPWAKSAQNEINIQDLIL